MLELLFGHASTLLSSDAGTVVWACEYIAEYIAVL